MRLITKNRKTNWCYFLNLETVWEEWDLNGEEGDLNGEEGGGKRGGDLNGEDGGNEFPGGVSRQVCLQNPRSSFQGLKQFHHVHTPRYLCQIFQRLAILGLNLYKQQPFGYKITN